MNPPPEAEVAAVPEEVPVPRMQINPAEFAVVAPQDLDRRIEANPLDRRDRAISGSIDLGLPAHDGAVAEIGAERRLLERYREDLTRSVEEILGVLQRAEQLAVVEIFEGVQDQVAERVPTDPAVRRIGKPVAKEVAPEPARPRQCDQRLPQIAQRQRVAKLVHQPARRPAAVGHRHNRPEPVHDPLQLGQHRVRAGAAANCHDALVDSASHARSLCPQPQIPPGQNARIGLSYRRY